MDENRPSVDAIVSYWADQYGNRFATAIRREAMRELIKIFVHYGYSRGTVETSKQLILKYCVGSRVKHGTLNDWKRRVLDDWQRTILEVFEPVQTPTGDVVIPFTPIHKTEAELTKESEEALSGLYIPDQEIPEEIQFDNEEVQSLNGYQFRPPLDKSIFPDIETTPIMSDDDFLASLESDKDNE